MVHWKQIESVCCGNDVHEVVEPGVNLTMKRECPVVYVYNKRMAIKANISRKINFQRTTSGCSIDPQFVYHSSRWFAKCAKRLSIFVFEEREKEKEKKTPFGVLSVMVVMSWYVDIDIMMFW